MKRLGLVLAAAVIAVASGCSVGSDGIRLLDVKRFEMASLSRAELTMLVENASRSTVRVLSGRLTVNIGGEEVAEAMLLEPVAVRRRSVEEADVKFGLRGIPRLALLSAASDPGDITVSGRVRFSAGLFPKNYEFREIPLSEIPAIFDLLNLKTE